MCCTSPVSLWKAMVSAPRPAGGSGQYRLVGSHLDAELLGPSPAPHCGCRCRQATPTNRSAPPTRGSGVVQLEAGGGHVGRKPQVALGLGPAHGSRHGAQRQRAWVHCVQGYRGIVNVQWDRLKGGFESRRAPTEPATRHHAACPQAAGGRPPPCNAWAQCSSTAAPKAVGCS